MEVQVTSTSNEGLFSLRLRLWNEELFSIKDNITSSRCIIIAGELVKEAREVVLCNVYAANTENEREQLWEFILRAQILLPGQWCIGGDFNTVLDQSERKGDSCNMKSIRNLQIFSLTSEDNKDLMQDAMVGWRNSKPKGSLSFVMSSNLKASKNQVKRWLSTNKVVSFSSKDCKNWLRKVETMACSDGWTEKFRSERLAILKEMWSGIRKEEQIWLQKSRVK
ncbi:hypothetical protein Dsin_009966 [Dipteronia sinensis]|uniref:Endonuclease/exonuclease/phosphatase domain-containing protein n=1 Tax=Dipteronia sinensis TaxID=43782 RepID=A0AAE0ARI6_9ROSI|nr:hypothetical protein Dsin_009966 [Dipteronia sinensis]